MSIVFWNEIPEAKYWDRLGAVPPIYAGPGFLLGEPYDIDTTGADTYLGYCEVGEKYFETSRPVSEVEFRAIPAPVGV